MVINNIDGIEFKLKEKEDFSWVKKYGTVFEVFDETGSGCLCLGVEKENKKYFFKIAGVRTLEAEFTTEESIDLLKKAVKLYKVLEHPNLIKLITEFNYKKYYIAVFEWVQGECLFDHWNFERYSKNPKLITPKERFKNLPVNKKLHCVKEIFSFLKLVTDKNYVAIDFYDGSIIYDFYNDKINICDIDLFKTKPIINNIGENFWGSKRLKSPEEYIYGEIIDEVTNIFTIGAIILDFFGDFDKEDINKRYINNRFLPCSLDKWTLNKESYRVLCKAVNLNRDERYKTIKEFEEDFEKSLVKINSDLKVF